MSLSSFFSVNDNFLGEFMPPWLVSYFLVSFNSETVPSFDRIPVRRFSLLTNFV